MHASFGVMLTDPGVEFLEKGEELLVLTDLTPQLLGGIPLLLFHRQAAIRTPEPSHLPGKEE